MSTGKIWFKGIHKRLWIPVSLEGWAVTLLFFVGVGVIHSINDVPAGANLTLGQVGIVALEFLVLIGVLYGLTRGRVDKHY
ncbi:hypothetical protein [Haliea sp. E17]|uniref:hypothetical protein n=1 Tax=Haliea sp. E17 TaxID=3401576 RepID=UPI003AAD0E5A